MVTAERLAVGITSQKDGVTIAIAEADAVGTKGGSLKRSIHGTSPGKLIGEKERKEVSKAVRLAMMV